jgi:uncharacterized protein YjbI with pentapeptide repeats
MAKEIGLTTSPPSGGLPSCNEFWEERLKYIEELSKNGGKLFTLMLTACAYAWLTIASTRDVALVTNTASSKLPILDTEVPIVGFYILGPPLLFALAVYLHHYLRALWVELARLPEILPPGVSRSERTYPWILNDLILLIPRASAGGRGFRRDRLVLRHPAVVIAALLTWCAVPATLCYFWLRYLSRHEWLWTVFQSAVFVVAAGEAIYTFTSARAMLRWDPRSHKGEAADTVGEKKTSRQHFSDWLLVLRPYFVLLGIVVLVHAFSSWFVFEAVPSDEKTALLGGIGITTSERSPGLSPLKLRLPIPEWLCSILIRLDLNPVADLREADVSTKPTSWTGTRSEELELVQRAHLPGQNLHYASAFRAFLVRAELKGADLQGADLQEADLRGAELEGADLEHACLTGACLRKADLREALVAGAHLEWADLRKATLEGAHLQDADLEKADLREADLAGAWLPRAVLQKANLRQHSLPQQPTGDTVVHSLDQAFLVAADLRNAHLDGASLVRTRLSWAKLESASLTKADLHLAYLSGAGLQNANLEDASLRDATLRQADLSGANLTRADLKRARLERAKLQGAYLLGAHLEEADLQGAHLEKMEAEVDFREKVVVLKGADLQCTFLEGAKFQDAHLEGADLRGAMKLTQDQLDAAFTDQTTRVDSFLRVGRKRHREMSGPSSPR